MIDVFNVCRTGVPPGDSLNTHSFVCTIDLVCIAGAVCGEEMTNELRWPLTAIGGSIPRFCLQTEGELVTHYLYIIYLLSTFVSY